MRACLFMPAPFDFPAISERVPLIITSSSQLALYTTAAGVSGVYPFMSSSTTFSIIEALKNTQMVALCEARLESLSASGTDVLPVSLVNITVCVSSGTVSSFLRAAAAAKAEDTPGITS